MFRKIFAFFLHDFHFFREIFVLFFRVIFFAKQIEAKFREKSENFHIFRERTKCENEAK